MRIKNKIKKVEKEMNVDNKPGRQQMRHKERNEEIIRIGICMAVCSSVCVHVPWFMCVCVCVQLITRIQSERGHHYIFFH